MTSQNRSTAVMQRRSEAHDSLDDFPTPPWATRALLEFLQLECPDFPFGTVREPAANRGHMVRPLAELFDSVEASDVHDYGAGFPVLDYLFGPDPALVDWTITNPPFRLAEQFIARARRTSLIGCAFLLRTAFLEGVGRHRSLFSVLPPSHVLQFSERVVMHKGRLAPEGSTATSYCWLVWVKPPFRSGVGSHLHWVPPSRARLEVDGDYPEQAVAPAEVGGLI